jgi:hypothetical protein
LCALSSTKLEIRTKQFLFRNEGVGGKERGWEKGRGQGKGRGWGKGGKK